jgi:uncharacterized OB-fold protein
MSKRSKPSMGLHDKPYWNFCQNNELRLQQCNSCSHIRYPPAPICPRCLEEGAQWHNLSGRGEVAAWTVFHRKYLPEFEVPYTIVSVRTDEGPLLIGQLLDAPEGVLKVGLPVKAFFEQVKNDQESWRICQWTPV